MVEKALGWSHLKVLAWAFLGVGLLSFAAFPRSWTIGAAVVFGPFAGPAVRHWRHCLEWAWQLAPFALGGLALGFAAQFLIEPSSPSRRLLRLTAWGLAWTGWFLFGLLSYAVALE